MKKIATIKYLKDARNSEHYNLQEQFLRVITAAFATKYGLTDLRDAYAAQFALEDEAYLQSQAYADTKEIEEKDALRDQLFRYVAQTVQAKTLSPLADEKAAAERVDFAVSPYAGAPGKPYAENSAMVADLVKKLQEDALSADVQTLGLTAAVASLKTANDDFTATYSRRAEEKRQRTEAQSLKEIRPLVDTAARALFDGIGALYLVNEMVEKDAEKRTEIGAVIDALNAEILQFSETLSRRGVGSKTQTGAEEER